MKHGLYKIDLDIDKLNEIKNMINYCIDFLNNNNMNKDELENLSHHIYNNMWVENTKFSLEELNEIKRILVFCKDTDYKIKYKFDNVSNSISNNVSIYELEEIINKMIKEYE